MFATHNQIRFAKAAIYTNCWSEHHTIKALPQNLQTCIPTRCATITATHHVAKPSMPTTVTAISTMQQKD